MEGLAVFMAIIFIFVGIISTVIKKANKDSDDDIFDLHSKNNNSSESVKNIDVYEENETYKHLKYAIPVKPTKTEIVDFEENEENVYNVDNEDHYNENDVIRGDAMLEFKVNVELFHHNITCISAKDIIFYMLHNNIALTPKNIKDTINNLIDNNQITEDIPEDIIEINDAENKVVVNDTKNEVVFNDAESEVEINDVKNKVKINIAENKVEINNELTKEQKANNDYIFFDYQAAILLFNGCDANNPFVATYKNKRSGDFIKDTELAYQICQEDYVDLSESSKDDDKVLYSLGVYHYIINIYNNEKLDVGKKKYASSYGGHNYQSERINADISKAIEYFLEAAKKGNIEANYMLGVIYRKGSLTSMQDNTKAVSYLNIGLERGHLESIIELSDIYERNHYYDKLIVLYEKAISMGFTKFKYNLGCAYSAPLNYKADYEKAHNMFEQSAAEGNKLAEEELKKFQKNLFDKWDKIKTNI